MNYNEILDKIKKIVNGTEESFAKAMLDDESTVIVTDGQKIASGQTAFITDSEGNRQAAPEGTHTLSDGRTITVDSEGTITEVADGGDDTPTSGDTGVSGDTEVTGSTETDKKVEELNERVYKMENALYEAVDKMMESEKEKKEKMEELSKAYEELSKQPAGSPSEYTTAEEYFGKKYENLSLSEKVQLNIENQK